MSNQQTMSEPPRRHDATESLAHRHLGIVRRVLFSSLSPSAVASWRRGGSIRYRMGHRQGTILIIVAGMSALIASLSLTFLVRMRADADESRQVIADVQARIMLVAGCNYIQEASRMGWEVGPGERETFGWVDVRDGLEGPKTRSADPNTGRTPAVRPEDGPRSVNFPVGTSARFPMWVWNRTPYAIAADAVFNPIEREPTSPDFAMPYLRHPDPQPVVVNYWTPGGAGSAVNDQNFDRGLIDPTSDYVHGDPQPRMNSTAMAWFRVHRSGPARFIITCGAGATQGFRRWTDMSLTDRQQFGNDESLWHDLRNQEVIMWYEVEWSPAVGGATYQCIDNEQRPDHYQWRPFNPVHENYPGGHQSQTHARNMVGTFRYIQRLRHEPGAW